MSVKKNDGKLTLSIKPTLTLKKIGKDDILKKISAEESATKFITRKGDKQEGGSKFASEASPLSFEERQKRIKAIESAIEVSSLKVDVKSKSEEKKKTPEPQEELIETLPENDQIEISPIEVEIKTAYQKEATQGMSDVINSTVKIDLKQEKKSHNEQKAQNELSSFSFKQGDGVASFAEIEKEVKQVKVDRRDKTIIDQMMKHYKYLEFDKEEDIEKLQKGLELRKALESRRKEVDSDKEDDDFVVNSFTSDSEDGIVRMRKEAYFSRHNRRSGKKRINNEPSFIQREIEIYDKNSVIDVARGIAVKVEEFIKKLKHYGLNVKENDIIDGDAAELMVEEMGHIAKRVKKLTAEDKIKSQNLENLHPVSPVVTIMGHVDHGKTTLLDSLREARVAEGEAGGITQKIGAYQTELSNGKKITFIDTPGHESFTTIRSRGASITHVIVIVIAADDGIMPQTVESIDHAKKSGVPIVIAINKIDRPGADIQKIKNELLAHEIVSDDLGGDVMCVPVSAKTGQNLDKLCEAILLQAEIFGAKAEFNAAASGVVLDARLDKQKGVVATLLVQDGTLKVGDIVLVESAYSKVRLMINDRGESIKKAEPSTPVEIYGLPDVPLPGQRFHVIESEKLAREISEHRKDKKIESKASVKDAFVNFFAPKTDKKYINILIKADVQSTIEAIKYSVNGIAIPSEIEIKIMQANVGTVTEADIKFAKSNDAVIFAFSIKLGSKEEELARKSGVAIKQHAVIYNIVDDIKELISSKLSPIVKDEVIGDAEVREIFDIFKIGKIAGSIIKKGLARRNAIVKIFRDNKEIGEGKLKTLKHFKENVKELAQGNECGIQVEGFEGFKPGDMLQIIDRTEEKRIL